MKAARLLWVIGGGAIVLGALIMGFVWFGDSDDKAAPRPASAIITHPNVPFPAELSGVRAESVYQAVKSQLSENYARSSDPVAVAYQSWKRFNKTPYRSPNHGERFVNHYANEAAEAYGKFENVGKLPVGSIVVKDSFVVTEAGELRTGPLFLMEKMGPDFRSEAGNWRFMMIRADGNVFGMTGGTGSENVKFCGECHAKAGPEHEYLFFMPEDARWVD